MWQASKQYTVVALQLPFPWKSRKITVFVDRSLRIWFLRLFVVFFHSFYNPKIKLFFPIDFRCGHNKLSSALVPKCYSLSIETAINFLKKSGVYFVLRGLVFAGGRSRNHKVHFTSWKSLKFVDNFCTTLRLFNDQGIRSVFHEKIDSYLRLTSNTAITLALTSITVLNFVCTCACV